MYANQIIKTANMIYANQNIKMANMIYTNQNIKTANMIYTNQNIKTANMISFLFWMICGLFLQSTCSCHNTCISSYIFIPIKTFRLLIEHYDYIYM